METYHNYKGFGITYYSITGRTEIDRFGVVIKKFHGVGELRGLELAKEFIDTEYGDFNLLSHSPRSPFGFGL